MGSPDGGAERDGLYAQWEKAVTSFDWVGEVETLSGSGDPLQDWSPAPLIEIRWVSFSNDVTT